MVGTGNITWRQHQQPSSRSSSDWCNFSDRCREGGTQPLAAGVVSRVLFETLERQLRWFHRASPKKGKERAHRE